MRTEIISGGKVPDPNVAGTCFRTVVTILMSVVSACLHPLCSLRIFDQSRSTDFLNTGSLSCYTIYVSVSLAVLIVDTRNIDKGSCRHCRYEFRFVVGHVHRSKNFQLIGQEETSLFVWSTCQATSTKKVT